VFSREITEQKGLEPRSGQNDRMLTESQQFTNADRTALDVTEGTRIEEALRRSEEYLRLTIDTIPILAWCSRPDGSNEFLNQRWLDYTGLSIEAARDWGWKVAIHPEDVSRLLDVWHNRMARDVHDTLAQGFTGVIVQLEAAEYAISEGDRKDADSRLRRAGELARMSLSEARRSVHALRPQALEQDDFWQALKGIVKNTTVGTTLQTTFEAQGKVPVLPQAWQENLLRIGQEALTNTLKYARARKFGTRLICNAKEVRLELCDDGDGFQVKERHDGVGLTGMRERAEEMGGELKIVSSRGKGTKITVLLPLNTESV
jgi:signal transduction histidine kinase